MNPENEKLRERLQYANSYSGDASDNNLVDAVFYLFTHSTKHTIAHVFSEHGTTINRLMCSSYARNKED